MGHRQRDFLGSGRDGGHLRDTERRSGDKRRHLVLPDRGLVLLLGHTVFREEVKSIPGAFCAMLMICAGLGGMSRFSHPPKRNEDVVEELDISPEMVPLTGVATAGLGGKVAKRKGDPQSTDIVGAVEPTIDIEKLVALQDGVRVSSTPPTSDGITPLEMDSMPKGTKKALPAIRKVADNIVLFDGRVMMSRRQLGLLGAVINGTWGGTSLIPMHYVKSLAERTNDQSNRLLSARGFPTIIELGVILVDRISSPLRSSDLEYRDSCCCVHVVWRMAPDNKKKYCIATHCACIKIPFYFMPARRLFVY